MAHKFDPQVKYAKSHEWERMEGDVAAVSYTHLTLPTSYSVEFSGVAVSFT